MAARLLGFHRHSGRWIAVLTFIFLIAAAARLLFLNTDPPLGLLDSGPYHDEGQYTRNARHLAAFSRRQPTGKK